MNVKPHYRTYVICWLSACALLIAAMVLVGGYTRLSGSGLSITDWKPLHGVIPPLNANEWQEEFAQYQQSPQYQKVNTGMSMAEFQQIFWPEFYHRLLGRAVGIVFLLPLLAFALLRAISRPFFFRMIAVFSLGGVQGVIGWYMVKSGLVNDPHVSHFRLAAHLSVAFVLFALILWAALDVAGRPATSAPRGLRRGMQWFVGLLFVQIVYGAFMAGLHAGLVFNTFPTMNGEWAPADMLALQPLWLNPLENITTIHFIHRWLAIFLVCFYVFWWWNSRKFAINRLRRLALLGLVIVTVQFSLGVATLLLQVPLPLALAHQFTALALFAVSISLMHCLQNTDLPIDSVNYTPTP